MGLAGGARGGVLREGGARGGALRIGGARDGALSRRGKGWDFE